MSSRTAAETIQQAISDFDSIKAAIENSGVEVPTPTPTRSYAALIAAIRKRDGAVGNALNLPQGLISNRADGQIHKDKCGSLITGLSGNITSLEDDATTA